MLKLVILLLAFLSAGMLTVAVVPFITERYHKLQKRKVDAATRKLDNLFVDVERRKIFFIFVISPVVIGLTGAFVYHNGIAAVMGGFLGIALPNVFIGMWERIRRERFRMQLLDGLMILSGCLKAGLSLMQAFEVMVEDMPAPISQEFGWVLKEIKMGINLEESLQRLNRRMPSEDLRLITNAILVASITGGDITKVFSRIVVTMRDNRKVKENIRTLTLQGRLQGLIMSALPFLFIWWILTFNRDQFDIMLKTEVGRTLLFVAAILLAVGIFLIRKFSTIKV